MVLHKPMTINRRGGVRGVVSKGVWPQHSLVVEELPVVVTLDVLPSLPQGDGDHVSPRVWLGAQARPPVDQGLLQLGDASLGQGLHNTHACARAHTHTELDNITDSLSHQRNLLTADSRLTHRHLL